MCSAKIKEDDISTIFECNSENYWDEHIVDLPKRKKNEKPSTSWLLTICKAMNQTRRRSKQVVTLKRKLDKMENKVVKYKEKYQRSRNKILERRYVSMKNEAMHEYYEEYAYDDFEEYNRLKNNLESQEWKSFDIRQKRKYTMIGRNHIVYKIMSNYDCKWSCGLFRENIIEIADITSLRRQIIFMIYARIKHNRSYEDIYHLYGVKVSTFGYWWEKHVDTIYYMWARYELVHGDPDRPQIWTRKKIMQNTTATATSVWNLTSEDDWIEEDDDSMASESPNTIGFPQDGSYHICQQTLSNHKWKKLLYSSHKYNTLCKSHSRVCFNGKIIEIDVFASNGHHNDRTIEKITSSAKYCQYCLDEYAKAESSGLRVPPSVVFTKEQAYKNLYLHTKLFSDNDNADIKICDNGYTQLGKDSIKTPIEEAKDSNHNTVMGANKKRRITLVREIVERVNRQMQCWKFLKQTVLASQIAKLRKIIVIVAATFNKWGPVMYSQDPKHVEKQKLRTDRFHDTKNIPHNPAVKYVHTAATKKQDHISLDYLNEIISDDEIYANQNYEIEKWTEPVCGFDACMNAMLHGNFFDWLRACKFTEEDLHKYQITSFHTKLSKNYFKALDKDFQIKVNMVNPFCLMLSGIKSMWQSGTNRDCVINLEYVIQSDHRSFLKQLYETARNALLDHTQDTIHFTKRQVAYMKQMLSRGTDPKSNSFWNQYDQMMGLQQMHDNDSDVRAEGNAIINLEYDNESEVDSDVNLSNVPQIFPDQNRLWSWNYEEDLVDYEQQILSGQKEIKRKINREIRDSKLWHQQNFSLLSGKFKYLQYYCICEGGGSVQHPCGHVWTAMTALVLGALTDPQSRASMTTKYRSKTKRDIRIEQNVTNLSPAKEWIKMNDPSIVCYCRNEKGERAREQYKLINGKVELANVVDAYGLILCNGCGVHLHKACALDEVSRRFWWEADGKKSKRATGKKFFCKLCIEIPMQLKDRQRELMELMHADDEKEENQDLLSQIVSESDSKFNPFHDVV